MYELDKPCVVYRDDCPLYEKVGDGMTNEKAIEELKAIKSAYSNKAFEDSRLMRSEIEALDRAIQALEKEPSGDLISRQAVLDILEKEGHKWGNDYRDWVDAIEEIKKLPPVNPQPKTGHWIEKDGFDGDTYYDCSECGESWTTIEGTPWDNEWNYCPNCGAKMIEPQESEE